MVAKILRPKGFPRRLGTKIPVKFLGSCFEQTRVQTIGGHPALLAKSHSSNHGIRAVVHHGNRGRSKRFPDMSPIHVDLVNGPEGFTPFRASPP